MGFNQAVSGLNAAASNLDVIGNNIANSQTVGFKSGSVTFADMFAGSKVGLGVKVASVQQDFTDGITTTTNRGLDVAISGNGFFRMQDANGGGLFSRDGESTLLDQCAGCFPDRLSSGRLPSDYPTRREAFTDSDPNGHDAG